MTSGWNTLLLLRFLSHARAYGEGNAAIMGLTHADSQPSLEWYGGDIMPCAVLNPGLASASVRLMLPADAVELSEKLICVHYTVRSDKAHAWWYVAPPPAELPQVACESPSHARPSRSAMVQIVLTFDVNLPLGYTRIATYLQQPRHSTTLLLPALTAVVAVMRSSESPAWVRAAGPPSLSEAELAALRESYRVVRADERPEKEAYANRTRHGRATYVPLHRFEENSSASIDALRGLLHPAWLAALTTPSPATLWPLIESPSRSHPVFRMALLSDEVRRGVPRAQG